MPSSCAAWVWLPPQRSSACTTSVALELVRSSRRSGGSWKPSTPLARRAAEHREVVGRRASAPSVEQHRPLDRVAQLADVARPRVAPRAPPARRATTPLHALLELAVEHVDEVLDQQRDVAARARAAAAACIGSTLQPVVEVLAERALPSPLLRGCGWSPR